MLNLDNYFCCSEDVIKEQLKENPDFYTNVCIIDMINKQSIMKEMRKEHIFDICTDGTKFYLLEKCDECFSVELTKEKAKQLEKLFKMISKML